MDRSTFADGFGRRFRSENDAALEWLRLSLELSGAPETEPNLTAKASRLSSLAHPQIAAVRRIERRSATELVVVSEAVQGFRLAELFNSAERRWVDPDLRACLFLLQEVTASVAALQRHERDLTHGAIGPERIIVRPDGTPVLVEAVLAAALEREDMGRARLWRQFRVPVPRTAGAAEFDQQTDVLQLGLLALALARGRMIDREDFPGRLAAVAEEVSVDDPLGHRPTLPRPVRSWLARALQLESRGGFRSAAEAQEALAEALKGLPVQPSRESAAAWTAAATGEGAVATAGNRGGEKADSGPAVAGGPVACRQAAPAPRVVQAGGRTAPAQGVRSLAPPARRRVSLRRLARFAGIAACLVLVSGATYFGARGYLNLSPAMFRTGQLVVESDPTGLEVLLNGKLKGTTPLTAEVRAGSYTLALRSSRSTTLVPVTVEAGTVRTERIEVRRGRLPIRSSTVRESASLPPAHGPR